MKISKILSFTIMAILLIGLGIAGLTYTTEKETTKSCKELLEKNFLDIKYSELSSLGNNKYEFEINNGKIIFEAKTQSEAIILRDNWIDRWLEAECETLQVQESKTYDSKVKLSERGSITLKEKK